MRRAMVRPLFALCLALAWLGPAHARTARLHASVVRTAVATLHDVQVDLDWPAAADHGSLRIRASRVDAPDLGYAFRNLDWTCPLHRVPRDSLWSCDGAVRSGKGAPMRLDVVLDDARVDVTLARGASRIAVDRHFDTPDITRVDLARVPVAWASALMAKAWPEGRFKRGDFDARLTVTAARGQPLRVAGPLTLRGVSVDTPDGSIAAENLGLQADLALAFGAEDRVVIDGHLKGGELLFGSAYVALADRSARLRIEASQPGDTGWRVPRFLWADGAALQAEGSAAFAPGGALRSLDVRARSDDLAPLRDAYLSGWLGAAGLSDLTLSGAGSLALAMREGALSNATLDLAQARIDDPKGRFAFRGLDGRVAFSGDAPVNSELRWAGGTLYGLEFGASRLPLASADGVIGSNERFSLPVLGGQAHFDGLQLRAPKDGQGTDVRFGLTLEALDVAQLAKTLGWPAFTGQLSGRIPQAHFANDRLEFDGGLDMSLFGGHIAVSSLAMERPFGVAPTLSADVALDNLDLESLTGVFGFGSITGKLDGRIDALRLVDWQPVAFDAHLRTDHARGVRQRISQRAVQDLSSVGDASFVSSLQSRLIGLFDDFGYSRIGISCRLADEVCAMDGLGSAGAGFIIVEGSGIPRLTVVGFNHRVDWPTLVERLAAVGKGDVKPVVQ